MPDFTGASQIWGRLTGIAGVSPAACAVGQRQPETRPHFESHPTLQTRFVKRVPVGYTVLTALNDPPLAFN